MPTPIPRRAGASRTKANGANCRSSSPTLPTVRSLRLRRWPCSQALALDPRPHYHNDPTRLYGLAFADYDVRFRVEGDQLTVVEIVEGKGSQPKKT